MKALGSVLLRIMGIAAGVLAGLAILNYFGTLGALILIILGVLMLWWIEARK